MCSSSKWIISINFPLTDNRKISHYQHLLMGRIRIQPDNYGVWPLPWVMFYIMDLIMLVEVKVYKRLYRYLTSYTFSK